MDHRRVVVAHEIPDRTPIQLTPGDVVDAGDRDTEWPEFVFVTTRTGESGWVPARYLSAAHGSVTVHSAYDTTELPTVVGERLEIVRSDPTSGWTWCRNAADREGWVPDRTLAPS